MPQDEKKLDDKISAHLRAAGGDPVHPNTAMQLRVAAVVPIHAATGPIRRTVRGKKVELRPSPDDLAYNAEMQREQASFIDSDEVVKAVYNRQDSIELLQIIKQRLARAAAALDFQRVEIQKYGKLSEAAQIVSRQVAALREIAATELEIQKRSETLIDVRSDKMQKIFAFWTEKIEETGKETLSPEQFDLFFNKLEGKMSGWEDEAEARIR